jgi:predicted outer membrane repeat protein
VVTEAEIVVDNDVILDGEDDLTVDANGVGRVFSVPAGVTAELRGMTVTGGRLTWLQGEEQGGGIHNAGDLTMTNSIVSDNSSHRDGGGIYNEGDLTMTNSTVSDNYASYDGGGIYSAGDLTVTNSTVSGNAAYFSGSGVYNGGNGTLSNSTVSGNLAEHGRGGGVYNGGTVTLSNSTVSGNSAADGRGGGFYNGGNGTLSNSTVSDNSAKYSGGGIYNCPECALTVTGTVVHFDRAHVVDGGCTYNIAAPIQSNGYNVESPWSSCGFDRRTDQVSVTTDDLNLGPLQDNGGPTMTHALGAGSVAIDQIPEADCVDADGQPLTTDQRGEPRPETGGTMCDVGAFEVQP